MTFDADTGVRTFDTLPEGALSRGVPNECAALEIHHGPFSHPLMRAILHKFGKVAFARSSACMEFNDFLHRIKAGGRTCLEIGTYQGISAVMLAPFFERVVCVSVDDDMRRIIKRDIVAYLGLQNRIQFFDCKDNEEKARVIRDQEFDFAYCDGDHAHDTSFDFELVRHCGRVLFHEYWPIQEPVFRLVNSLPQHQITRADYDCFAFWDASK